MFGRRLPYTRRMNSDVVDLSDSYCRIPMDDIWAWGQLGMTPYDPDMDVSAYERGAIDAMGRFLELECRQDIQDKTLVMNSGSEAFTAVIGSTRRHQRWSDNEIFHPLITDWRSDTRIPLNDSARFEKSIPPPSQRSILMSSPGISYPYEFAQRYGFETVHVVPAKGPAYRPDVDAICKLVKSTNIDVLYLESPSNIGGHVLTERELLKLFDACRRSPGRTLLVVDHCFAALAPPNAKVPLLADVMQQIPTDNRHRHNWVMLWDSGKTLFRRPGEKLGFAIFGRGVAAQEARQWAQLEKLEPDIHRLRVCAALMRGATRIGQRDPMKSIIDTIRRNGDAFFASRLAQFAVPRGSVDTTVAFALEPYLQDTPDEGTSPMVAMHLRSELGRRAGVRVTDATAYFDPRTEYRDERLPFFSGNPVGGGYLRLALARPTDVFLKGLGRLENHLLGVDRELGGVLGRSSDQRGSMSR